MGALSFVLDHLCANLLPPRKRGLRRLFFYRCLLSGEGGGGIPACIAGGIPACLVAGLWGWWWYPSMPCRFTGPHPRGKFRGIWPGGGSPGPHPKGKLRGSGPGPQPRGKLRGSSWGVIALGSACSGGMPAQGGGSCFGREGVWRPSP